jgi:hypothetical protein
VLPAAFARDGDKIEVGHIYVAPPDHHMVLGFDSIRLNQGPKVHYTLPAADPLFESRAAVLRNCRQPSGPVAVATTQHDTHDPLPMGFGGGDEIDQSKASKQSIKRRVSSKPRCWAIGFSCAFRRSKSTGLVRNSVRHTPPPGAVAHHHR